MKDSIPTIHQPAVDLLSRREVKGEATSMTDLQDLTTSPAQSKIFAQEASSGEQVDDESPEYPKGPKLVIIVLALCLAVFLVALDQTIISTAIPKITDDFHSVNDVGW